MPLEAVSLIIIHSKLLGFNLNLMDSLNSIAILGGFLANFVVKFKVIHILL